MGITNLDLNAYDDILIIPLDGCKTCIVNAVNHSLISLADREGLLIIYTLINKKTLIFANDNGLTNLPNNQYFIDYENQFLALKELTINPILINMQESQLNFQEDVNGSLMQLF